MKPSHKNSCVLHRISLPPRAAGFCFLTASNGDVIGPAVGCFVPLPPDAIAGFPDRHLGTGYLIAFGPLDFRADAAAVLPVRFKRLGSALIGRPVSPQIFPPELR